MKIIQIYMHNMLRNFNYIVYSEKSKDAIFFDPLDIEETLKIAQARGLNPRFLVNTHYHPDHMKDNEKFLTLTQAKKIELKQGQRLYLSEEDYIEALDTPGHVMNHQCFFVGENQGHFGLITGDALFNAGVGHCRLGGNVEVHFQTTYYKLRVLDENIKIYPSHDYLLTNLEFAKTIEPENQQIDKWFNKRKEQNVDEEFMITTLKEEKEINPFLRLESEGMEKLFPQMSLKERFIELRKRRDNW